MVFCKVEINSQGYKARLYSAPRPTFIIFLKLLINFDGNEAWPPIIKKFFFMQTVWFNCHAPGKAFVQDWSYELTVSKGMT